MTKRTTQQINRAALNGHPRWCPKCQQMVSTHRGKFAKHGRTDAKTFECPASGQSVKAAQAAAQPVG